MIREGFFFFLRTNHREANSFNIQDAELIYLKTELSTSMEVLLMKLYHIWENKQFCCVQSYT